MSVIEGCYERLKEDVLGFKQKGRVVLLGDFNARVGKAVDMDDVIGEICNSNGNRMISFLHEVELGICMVGSQFLSLSGLELDRA